MPGARDSLYVVARRVLLDALEKLKEHRENLILVGAQAVCLWQSRGPSDLCNGEGAPSLCKVVDTRVMTPSHWAAGEEGEFADFFRALYPRLVRALFLLTRGDQPEAEDLAQEAMARAFSRWERLRRMQSPQGYVFRVALNLGRRRLGRSLRRRPALQAWAPPDPAAAAETAGDVHRALASMPIRHREILVLADCLDMPIPELSEVLRITPGAARVRLHRARAAFRQKLGEGYE